MPRSFDHFSLTCDDLGESLARGRMAPHRERRHSFPSSYQQGIKSVAKRPYWVRKLK